MEAVNTIVDKILETGSTEALIQFHREQKADDARRAYYGALTLAQGNFLPIVKTGENKHTNTRYETLADIQRAVTGPLQAQSLTLSHKPKVTPESCDVTVVMTHVEGHQEESTVSLALDTSGKKHSIHAAGSSLTYATRYAMKAMLNLVIENEDDDGVAGGAAQVELVTEEQAADIEALVTEKGRDRDKMFAHFGAKYKVAIESYAGIPASIYTEIITTLNKAR